MVDQIALQFAPEIIRNGVNCEVSDPLIPQRSVIPEAPNETFEQFHDLGEDSSIPGCVGDVFPICLSDEVRLNEELQHLISQGLQQMHKRTLNPTFRNGRNANTG